MDDSMCTAPFGNKVSLSRLSYIHKAAENPEYSSLPILFIHGTESSKETWKGPIQALKENVYAIDLRGHGDTPIGCLENYTLENLVQDVCDFAECHGLVKFILVAHSMGARIATSFAAKKPECVAGYIIEDMEMVPREKEPIDDGELRRLMEFNQDQSSIATAMTELRKHGYSEEKILSWIRQGRIAETEDGVHIGINPLVTHLVKNIISNSRQPAKDFKKLGSHDIPMLLLKAGLESSVSENGLKAMQKACPKLIVKEIPDASHSIHKVALQAFLASIQEFVQHLRR